MPESLERARELVAQLDFPAAQQLLHDELAHANQDPSLAEADEADVAALYAGVLLHLSEPHTARTWATYAYAAMRRIHGERDRRTLHVLGVLAVCESRAGALDRATRHYQQLVSALSAVDGPEADRTLAARADATFVEHARGMCAGARTQLADIISVHAGRHGPAHPVGIRMTARLAGMWRDCGDFDRAHQLLTHARAQAASIPADDEIHRLLSAASRAPADRHHQCGVESAQPGTGGQPGVFPVLVVPEPQDFIPPSRMDATTPEVTEWPDDEILDPPARQQNPMYPSMYSPPAPHGDELGDGHAAPLGPTQFWSPDGSSREVQPARQYWGAGGSPREEQPAPLAPAPPISFAAPRHIPVPMPLVRPPLRRPERRRSRNGSLAAIAVGALAAAAVVMVAVALVKGGNDPQDPPGTNATTGGPIGMPQGPVSNLQLTDQGDRVLITWIYPVDATGPIIVSAAKAGEPMRALQSLPMGTESMLLPGLDPKLDYCVTVTVAYSPEHMVMAPAACTERN